MRARFWKPINQHEEGSVGLFARDTTNFCSFLLSLFWVLGDAAQGVEEGGRRGLPVI